MARVPPARRHEISRLEAFSDAAFAFALTLLVVSMEVPKSYIELVDRIRGVPAFACCFAILVWIWHEHNMFFRRYGLQDAWTIFLNAVLLFIVLFYVYPLKFMFDSLFDRFLPGAQPGLVPMSFSQLSRAAAIYGAGFVLLFVMFGLLYLHAWRRRHELHLTEIDVFDVQVFAGHHLVSLAVGLVAIGVALLAPLHFAPLSPACFSLMGPGHWMFGRMSGKRRKAFLARQQGAVEPAGT